jgi:hypothetical protein
MRISFCPPIWLPEMRVPRNHLFLKIFSPISRLDVAANLPTLPIHGPAATIRVLKDKPRLFTTFGGGTHDE